MPRTHIPLEGDPLIVKVGTDAQKDLESSAPRIDKRLQKKLGREMLYLLAANRRLVIVTSAAMIAGLQQMGETQEPTNIVDQRAFASIGSDIQVNNWRFALGEGYEVGFVPISDPALQNHTQQQVKGVQTINRLHEMGVVPVVNEPDATNDEEFNTFDNDRLAALLGIAIDSDVLCLSDKDGLLADPDDPATVIPTILASDNPYQYIDDGEKSESGRGGARSKVESARLLNETGGREFIWANSRTQHVIRKALGGVVGTRFLPTD